MAVNDSEKLETLFNLIREVKPSLGSSPIKLEDSLVEDLGLDSLDTLQLVRKVRRIFGASFDPQAWGANRLQHKYSVRSLLDATDGVQAVERQQVLSSNESSLQQK
jgi:acyl carrier protein